MFAKLDFDDFLRANFFIHICSILVCTDLIAETLKKGLEETCSSNLVISFLLARHCSAEGSHIFMSYSDWFQVC